MGVLYWISTGLISVFLAISSYSYIFHSTTIEGIKDLGFPDFFRIQLAILKIIAAIFLLIPNIPVSVKEWCYAGIAFFLITAVVAHVAHKDSVGILLLLCAIFIVLITSYVIFRTHYTS